MDHPAFIQLYPTLRCNQECIFCFNQNLQIPVLGRDMSESHALSLVDISAERGIREIDILGGEPLLVPWIKNFVIYASDSGIAVNLSTNGGLTDLIVDFAKVSSPSVNIGLSILGLSGTHNRLTKSTNFSRAVKAIERLISYGRSPIVKSVLMRENREEIFSLAAFLASVGVKRYYLLHEDVIGRHSAQAFSFPEYYSFYEALKKEMEGKLDTGFVAASGFYKCTDPRAKRCDAGVTKLAVMPDGSAFPCNLLAGSQNFLLGNIFTDGLDRIWNHPALEHFRTRGIRNPCQHLQCRHFATCAGGCPAHSYFLGGSLDKTDPRCRFLDLHS